MRQQKIFTGNTWKNAEILSISDLPTGRLITYDVEDYGLTQPFFEKNGEGYNMDDRRNRSMMPAEYVYKSGSAFRWDIYGETLDRQKKLANAFVVKFPEFEKSGRGLYIFSKEKGSGKTLLACCLCNEVLKLHDISVKFISLSDFIELVKSKETYDKERVDSIYHASLLILDDIRKIPGRKEWAENEVFRLIDHRRRELLPTIFTSNHPINELEMDERILSRIEEVSLLLKMPEKSIRSMKAAESNQRFLEGLLEG